MTTRTAAAVALAAGLLIGSAVTYYATRACRYAYITTSVSGVDLVRRIDRRTGDTWTLYPTREAWSNPVRPRPYSAATTGDIFDAEASALGLQRIK